MTTEAKADFAVTSEWKDLMAATGGDPTLAGTNLSLFLRTRDLVDVVFSSSANPPPDGISGYELSYGAEVQGSNSHCWVRCRGDGGATLSVQTVV